MGYLFLGLLCVGFTLYVFETLSGTVIELCIERGGDFNRKDCNHATTEVKSMLTMAPHRHTRMG